MIWKLGVQWETEGLRSFKLLGWEFYVEGSPEGWRYCWEGDNRRPVFFATREAAMRAGLTDLIKAIDYAFEDEEPPKRGPRSVQELRAELAKIKAKLAVHYLVKKAREVRGIR